VRNRTIKGLLIAALATAGVAVAAPPATPAPAPAGPISLKYPGGSLPHGGTATVTAYTNADVGPSPWYIEIFRYDVNPYNGAYATPTRVAICGGGSSCAVTQSFSETGYTYRYAHYAAYVSSNSTASPPDNVQATSDEVRIDYDQYWHGG
jgi:hypothetical protein